MSNHNVALQFEDGVTRFITLLKVKLYLTQLIAKKLIFLWIAVMVHVVLAEHFVNLVVMTCQKKLILKMH
jgi:hypothetical protein